MTEPRIVVAGAGHLGTYHVQKMLADTQARLVGFVEPDETKRAQKALEWNIPGQPMLNAFVGKADAVVVATPTSTHFEVCAQALEMGLHVLVEKPITPTVAEAQKLLGLAQERGLVLQVGHTERWNPAVTAALAVTDRPGYIVTERLGRFTGRSTDVDVVLDLMIHDLDIVSALVPAALVEVRSVGVPVLTHEVDMAAARLQFEDGTVAQLSAGRSSLEPVRKIRLFTRERYLSIDCATRDVKSVRRLPPEPGSTWPQISGELVEVPPGDPLALQDHDFVVCVRDGKRPKVDGAAGLRALELACAVKEALSVPAFLDFR